MLTVERARERLSYDPATGALTWLERPRSEFSRDRLWVTWNKRWAGKEAGSVGVNGYRYVTVDGVKYLSHRVIWLIATGAWPANDIDHEHGRRSDNQFDALREATRGENLKNCCRRKDNSSGTTGVYLDRSRGKWVAVIHSDGITHHLGRHESIDDAIAARKSAEAIHGFHENHGREAA